MTNQVTIDGMVKRWEGLDRPLFRGKLIDEQGCCCAQGDVLRCSGWSDEQLRSLTQNKADAEVAKILSISRTHSVLLRLVNDTVGGYPQNVLSSPETIIGDKAPLLLAFWFHLDNMRAAAWDAAWTAAGAAAWDAAWSAAGAAAWDAAWSAAGTAAWTAARAAAWDAARAAAGTAARTAARASGEIQGMDILRKQGREPYFLAFFGIKTWEQVENLVRREEK